jgi:hypothetical protein
MMWSDFLMSVRCPLDGVPAHFVFLKLIPPKANDCFPHTVQLFSRRDSYGTT